MTDQYDAYAGIMTKAFIFFIVLKGLIEAWLESRNKNFILQNRAAVPDKFKEVVSLEEHQKAADYSVTKINTSQVFHWVGLAILLVWTLGGGLNFIERWATSYNQGPIIHGLIFFCAFMFISLLLSLPQTLYSTFVVEEKFGFNKMTPKLFIIDMFKGLLLGGVIGLPLLAALLYIMDKLGNLWWFYAWGLLTAFQIILLSAYPRFIAPLFNKFNPLEEGEVKEKVLGLLESTGFKSQGLFVMNASIRSSHGNAYFTGFGKNKRIVFFDTLIKSLTAGEVQAVLAHELGHFKRKHVLKQLVRGTIFSLIGFFILGKLLLWPAFFQGHGVDQVTIHSALLLFSMVSGFYTFWITPLTSMVSRKYEYEADTFAAEHAKATDLITALVKLYKENASTLTPDPIYSAYYHSHPPALARVKHLEGL
jgi:STE24 endopeptidase